MPDEPNVSTPEVDGTIEPDVQPQTDPDAAPDKGTTEPDKQDDGTTEPQVDGREPLYQTKYQDTLAELNALKQVNAKPPDKEPIKPDQQPGEYETDLTTEEGVAQFKKDLITGIAGEFDNRLTRQAQVAEYNEQLRGADAALLKWKNDNKVPDKVMVEAINKVSQDFPGGRPAVLAEYVIHHIQMKGEQARYQKQLANEIKDAAEKSKDLKGVEQPKPGSAPDPQPSTEKTLNEKVIDRFEEAGKNKTKQIF